MTFDKVKEILAKQLQLSADSIKLEDRLVEDLKADSANVMMLVIEVENAFGIEVEDDAILTLKTVADVVNYIDKAE